MRTALWETSPGALAALLNSRAPLNKADLYTLTLASGAVFRWSGSDLVLSGGGHTWTLGPGLQRTAVKFVVGVQVDTMTVTITDNAATLINGRGLMAFIRAGGLQGARLQLDRAFWGVGDTAPVGALLWFTGRVADIELDRYSAQLSVKSDLELLDVMVPRDVYQSGCLNTLFDGACGKSRAAYTVSDAVLASPAPTRSAIAGTLAAYAAGYFDLGVVTFTAGANAGVSRTVKSHTTAGAKVLSLVAPLPFAPAAGDAFNVYPGCDKAQATCNAKFGNLGRFRGMPYVPAPETVT